MEKGKREKKVEKKDHVLRHRPSTEELTPTREMDAYSMLMKKRNIFAQNYSRSNSNSDASLYRRKFRFQTVSLSVKSMRKIHGTFCIESKL